jgi:hypothetical protein
LLRRYRRRYYSRVFVIDFWGAWAEGGSIDGIIVGVGRRRLRKRWKTGNFLMRRYFFGKKKSSSEDTSL